MKRTIARAVLAAGLFMASGAGAEPPRSIFEVAQDIQTFYPVGSARTDDSTLEFYVMAGLSGTGTQTLRGAVLINTATGPGEHIQIVEVQSIACGSRSLTPTFRLVLNSKGQMLSSSGPVPTEGDGSGTLLTPDAVRKTVAILCDEIEPKNELLNRSLADFQ